MWQYVYSRHNHCKKDRIHKIKQCWLLLISRDSTAYNEGFKKAYTRDKSQKQEKKKKKKQEVFLNSAPVATILREGLPLVEDEKKRKKEKHQDGSGDGKEEDGEAKEGISEGREEEAGILNPCPSPDS